jgi:hypothetical protein
VSEQATPAATLVTRDKWTIAHLLAIEGLPYMWTDDETGELLGSDFDSWIGESQDAIGLEEVGTRIVLPGLRMPRNLHEGIDPKIGMLQSQNVTFKLVELDGTLSALLASEGKAFDVLAQDIQPGTSALATSVGTAGGLTTNPRGRYIGLERIGPNGERAYFPPVPTSWIGYHHAVNIYGQGEEGPRPIPISDDPLDFVGRRVVCYQLLRRRSRSGNWEDWPLWDEQAATEGAMLWWGKLLDRGTIEGSREWTIRCQGAESWLRRTLNAWAPGWSPLSDAIVGLTEPQRQIAIKFFHEGAVDLSVGYTTTLSASGDKDTWIGEINALISDVMDGTTSDYGIDPFEDFNSASSGFYEDGTFWIRREAIDRITHANSGAVGCGLAMHETVWRELGWDPALQATSLPFADEYGTAFKWLEAGENAFGFDAVNAEAPAAGFWRAQFDTLDVGLDGDVFSPSDGYGDNGGNPRLWRPINQGELVCLTGPAEVPQTLRLGFDQPFLEGLQTVPRVSEDVVTGPTEQARYFAIRGKRAVGTPIGPGQIINENGSAQQLEDVEPEDFGQLIRGEWLEAGYGALVEGDGRPTLYATRYEDPRLAGMPFGPQDGEWAALNSPDGASGLEIAPLLTYGYGQGMAIGRAIECWYQILLSTGTATGFADSEDTDPSFGDGNNSHAGQSEPWCVDALRYDHGLAIPSDFVQEPDDGATEWDRVPGGKSGALSRIGLAYVGAQDSLKVLESIVRPRGLAMSLDGGRYGVVYLAPFSPNDATVTIGEEDLYGDMDDPGSTIPKQELRAMGQLDKVELKYRYNPIEETTALEKTLRARDREAVARRGDVKVELEDHGLVPSEWLAPGVSPWELDFRELWEVDKAEFFARRHFLITNLTVKPGVGRSIRVGTRVRITNPWPVNPAASAGNGADAQGYGVAEACGIVVDWDYDTQTRAYTLKVLVFAGQFEGVHLYMPWGQIVSTSGAALTMAAEDAEQGISGAARFALQDWMSGSEMNVRIVSHDRVDWYVSSVYSISSIAGNVITLTGTPTASDVYRDRDLFLIPAEFAQQSGRWPAAHGLPIVLDTLQHPGGAGFPLEP